MYRGEWFSGQKGPLGVRENTHSGAHYDGSWTLGIQDGHGVELYADTSASFTFSDFRDPTLTSK